MRMEFMVDAQNIAHCPKQKDQLKAKIWIKENVQHLKTTFQ
jgi:hypothetical protein